VALEPGPLALWIESVLIPSFEGGKIGCRISRFPINPNSRPGWRSGLIPFLLFELWTPPLKTLIGVSQLKTC
jgi:hypothetical protein